MALTRLLTFPLWQERVPPSLAPAPHRHSLARWPRTAVCMPTAVRLAKEREQRAASLAASLEGRIAELEQRQRASSIAAGKKAGQILRLNEQLQKLDKQRAAKLRELHAAQEHENAPTRRQSSSSSSSTPPVPPPLPPPRGWGNDVSLSSAVPRIGRPAAASSSSADVPRPPRVLLGVCLPHFVGPALVHRLVLDVHEKLCAFADVRIVCMNEAKRAQGFDEMLEEVKAHSRSRQRKQQLEGSAETTCFSNTDEGFSPYHAASELNGWADVLVIAPMSTATLTAICMGREDDLLLEIVQNWGAKKTEAMGDFWLPLKPFMAAPWLPAECCGQLIIEKHMGTLGQMGVGLVDDPGEERLQSAGHDKYVTHLTERVHLAVLNSQGGHGTLQLSHSQLSETMSHASGESGPGIGREPELAERPAGAAKRRRRSA